MISPYEPNPRPRCDVAPWAARRRRPQPQQPAMNSRNSVPGEIHHGMSRRSALGLGGAALAAFAVREPFATAAVPATQFSLEAPRPEKGLRVAPCQFPVSGNVEENARHICDFMRRAVKSGAHVLHTSEAALSGYAGIDVPSLDRYDWELLRRETAGLRGLAKELDLWLVLGSTHYLDAQTKPTNEPGKLVHDFPDGLSKGGWYHNERPLRLRDDELMSWGQPSQHPRPLDSRAEP